MKRNNRNARSNRKHKGARGGESPAAAGRAPAKASATAGTTDKTGSKRAGAASSFGGSSGGAASSRRNFLRLARNVGVIGCIVGIGGWYAVTEVRATIAESDLSRIGNGIPSVVQIHDPGCPMCRALQRETREALEDFADTDLQYLVANIRDPIGRGLANRHGVGHVTLLLFDGDGDMVEVLRGQSSSAALRSRFRRHLARHANPGS